VDEAPSVFLRVLGIVPAGVEPQLIPLRPETAPAVAMPDFVAWLTIPPGDPFIFHVEFFVRYSTDIAAILARYGVSLAWQYRCPVMSLVVLLRRQGVPKRISRVGRFDVGETKARHPFRVVRLWKIDPTAILETGDWRLLPWSVLMRSSDAEVRRVAEILAREGDEESIGRFVTLGSLRYHRGQLEEMLGESKMGLVEAILEGSSLVREVRERAAKEAREQGRTEGLAEGLAEGEARGRTEGLSEGRVGGSRNALKVLLGSKFPGLETMPEIAAISTEETFVSLLKVAIESNDREAVQRSITAAARLN